MGSRRSPRAWRFRLRTSSYGGQDSASTSPRARGGCESVRRERYHWHKRGAKRSGPDSEIRALVLGQRRHIVAIEELVRGLAQILDKGARVPVRPFLDRIPRHGESARILHVDIDVQGF